MSFLCYFERRSSPEAPPRTTMERSSALGCKAEDDDRQARRLRIFYPNYFRESQIAAICLELGQHMPRNDLSVDVMGTASSLRKAYPFYCDAIPRLLQRPALRVLSQGTIKSIAEKRFLRSLLPADIVYLFPGSSATLLSKLKKRPNMVVAEYINTHQATAKRLLDEEYRRYFPAYTHSICLSDLDYEEIVTTSADFFLSPSPTS